ncbi:MAG: YidH family protein [Acidimicrobiales bacterium]
MDAEQSARVRDRLASDRTLLAWLRTGIAVSGLGFVVAKFGLFLKKLDQLAVKAPPRTGGAAPVSAYLGVALVSLGGLLTALGFVQHRGTLRQERVAPGGPRPAEWPIVVATAGCMVTIAVLAVYLVVTSR